jgi:hypothetical protein
VIDAALRQRSLDERLRASELPAEGIHHIAVDAFSELRGWDFSHTAEMIETGRQAALDYLRRQVLA